MKQTAKIIIVVLVLSFVITGCFPQRSPEEVVEEFLVTLVLEEWNETLPFLSREVRGDIDADEDLKFISQVMGNFLQVNYEVKEGTIEDDEAEVPFIVRAVFSVDNGDKEEWELKQSFFLVEEEGRWKISDIDTLYLEIKELKQAIKEVAENIERILGYQRLVRDTYPENFEDVVGVNIEDIPALISDINYNLLKDGQEYELFLDSQLFDTRWIVSSENDIKVETPIP